MAVAGLEWFFLFIIIIVVIWLIVRSHKKRVRKRMEDLSIRALAVIRSKGGKASVDDIIVLGGIPPSLLNKVMGNLLERGIVIVAEEEGRIVYKLA